MWENSNENMADEPTGTVLCTVYELYQHHASYSSPSFCLEGQAGYLRKEEMVGRKEGR